MAPISAPAQAQARSMILVLSTSLRSASRSRLLAAAAHRQLIASAHRQLIASGHAATLLDLRDFPLPLCDGDTADRHPNVTALTDQVSAAAAVIVATPIYNFDASAALKNVIELTGPAWENKVAAFLCAAGGDNSYMSILSFANSLMLDFRTVIVPRFVYATGAAFEADTLTDPDIIRRIAELTHTTALLARALKAA